MHLNSFYSCFFLFLFCIIIVFLLFVLMQILFICSFSLPLSRSSFRISCNSICIAYYFSISFMIMHASDSKKIHSYADFLSNFSLCLLFSFLFIFEYFIEKKKKTNTKHTTKKVQNFYNTINRFLMMTNRAGQ